MAIPPSKICLKSDEFRFAPFSYFNRLCKIFNKTQNSIENAVIKRELINSYSQYGEDLVIDGILGNKRSGFFIDVGANDPVVFNNTKRFYDRGWSGINIEPNPSLLKRLVEQRPRDINLNLGLGLNNREKLPFYVVSADTLSSFNKMDAERNCKIYKEKIIETLNIPTQTLLNIFDDYVKESKVDFLSVDVEGFELDVLKGNDWDKYRPTLILIEINNNTERLVSYLENVNYVVVFKNSTNGIFLDVRNSKGIK